jgi:hypothetical protein
MIYKVIKTAGHTDFYAGRGFPNLGSGGPGTT